MNLAPELVQKVNDHDQETLQQWNPTWKDRFAMAWHKARESKPFEVLLGPDAQEKASSVVVSNPDRIATEGIISAFSHDEQTRQFGDSLTSVLDKAQQVNPWNRIPGMKVVEQVMDDFVGHMATDPRNLALGAAAATKLPGLSRALYLYATGGTLANTKNLATQAGEASALGNAANKGKAYVALAANTVISALAGAKGLTGSHPFKFSPEDPTPGTTLSIKQFGADLDLQRSLEATALGKKPLTLVVAKEPNQVGVLQSAMEKGLAVAKAPLGDGYVCYPNTPAGKAAMERLEEAVLSKDETAIGKALGYSDLEVRDFVSGKTRMDTLNGKPTAFWQQVGTYPIKRGRLEGIDPLDKQKRLPADLPDLDKPLYEVKPPAGSPMSPTGYSGGFTRINNKNRYALNALGFSPTEVAALNHNPKFADAYLDHFVNDTGQLNKGVDPAQVATTVRQSFGMTSAKPGEMSF